MEVHPPEHPIFTWKQFLIHMATVCLGLLIALPTHLQAVKNETAEGPCVILP